MASRSSAFSLAFIAVLLFILSFTHCIGWRCSGRYCCCPSWYIALIPFSAARKVKLPATALLLCLTLGCLLPASRVTAQKVTAAKTTLTSSSLQLTWNKNENGWQLQQLSVKKEESNGSTCPGLVENIQFYMHSKSLIHTRPDIRCCRKTGKIPRGTLSLHYSRMGRSDFSCCHEHIG